MSPRQVSGPKCLSLTSWCDWVNVAFFCWVVHHGVAFILNYVVPRVVTCHLYLVVLCIAVWHFYPVVLWSGVHTVGSQRRANVLLRCATQHGTRDTPSTGGRSWLGYHLVTNCSGSTLLGMV